MGNTWRANRQTLKPKGDFSAFGLPEDAWDEAVDPVGFLVGSILVVFLGRATAGEKGTRVSSILWIALAVLIPVLVGVLFPHFGTGDPLSFGLTLLLAGVVTFVPSRLAELRASGHVPGDGYPKRLRQAMWNVEAWLAIGAVVVILVWTPQEDEIVRGIACGVLAVCAAELYTYAGVALAAAQQSSGDTEEPVEL